MFENAKLKDEVAMQGVGITNLTGRLAKQRKACDKCRSYLRKYRQKAERLREQLAIVTSRKNDIAKRKKYVAPGPLWLDLLDRRRHCRRRL